MKKIRRMLGFVLCLVLVLTAVTFVKPVTAEAATKCESFQVVKTNSWIGGASVTIKNYGWHNLTVSVRGGYAANDGKSYTIKPNGSRTFRFRACSGKGATFTLTMSGTLDGANKHLNWGYSGSHIRIY